MKKYFTIFTNEKERLDSLLKKDATMYGWSNVSLIKETNETIIEDIGDCKKIFFKEYWTGSVDVEGLLSIGWSLKDIRRFKQYINWNKEIDNEFMVPQGDKDLLPMDASKIKSITKYCPIIHFNSAVSSLEDLFSGSKQLISTPLFDTRNVTNMDWMFDGCEKLLSVPQFDTRNVTNMVSMFSGCVMLPLVPKFDTSKVTNMFSMFNECSSLISVPLFNTSNVTNMNRMFKGCRFLESIPELDTSNVANMDHMFYNCSSLTTLGGFKGLKCNLDLSTCPNLTHESLMNVINNASSGVSGVTLTLGYDNFKKLSEAERKIATNKGWTLA